MGKQAFIWRILAGERYRDGALVAHGGGNGADPRCARLMPERVGR